MGEYGEEDGNFDGVFVNDNLVETFSKIKKEFKEWYPHLVECTKKKPEEVTSSEIDNDADKSESESASAAASASASTSASALALARGNTDEKKEKEIIEESSYPCPVVFSGPSGVGKGTLIEMLMKQFPSNQFGFSVSHTTRSPREGETDGVHYNFTSVNKMKNEIDEGQFIEYAEVHGNYYGTSVEAVESVKKQGKICILDIDVQGVSNVKKSSLESKYIFIAPPSMDVLEKRLRGRGTEKEEDITKRLSNAAKEMEYGEEDGNFDDVFVNDNLVEDFSKIKKEFKEWYPHLVECTKKKPEEVTSS